LLVAAGGVGRDLGLGAEQPGIGSAGLLGGQEAGDEVGPSEAVGIDSEGGGVEDEHRQRSGDVGARHRHVLVDVALEIAEGGAGGGQVDVGGR
jgi:hypothetical protein